MTFSDHMDRINKAQNADRLESVIRSVKADKSLSPAEIDKLLDRGAHRLAYFAALSRA